MSNYGTKCYAFAPVITRVELALVSIKPEFFHQNLVSAQRSNSWYPFHRSNSCCLDPAVIEIMMNFSGAATKIGG